MSSEDSTSLEIELILEDLNEVKRLTGLATNVSTAYISLTTATLTDMNENEIEAIDRFSATRVSKYVEDTTAPALVSFDLDLTTEQFTLFFSDYSLSVGEHVFSVYSLQVGEHVSSVYSL